LVWSTLVASWRRHRDASAAARRPIPDLLWRRTLKRFPFLPRGDADEAALRQLASVFLDRKEFSGAHGLVVSDDIAVAVAAQACLPILRLGIERYDGFVGIVVHPAQARVRRSRADADGVVHEYEEVLSGEAVEGGPVMLSWRDVRASGASAALGYNVVVHEFAHVLDMADGLADGVPLLPAELPRREWLAVMDAEYEEFCDRLDRGEETALDPYAGHAPEEFFAVSSESFFVDPLVMRAEHPRLYALFQRFYRQDPAARQPAPTGQPPAGG
jgi:hypothetical protein